MKYNKARKILKNWDIIIYNNNTLFWKVIRFFTWEKATHAAIAIWLWPRLFIYESIEWSWVINELASKRLLKGNIVKLRRRRVWLWERTLVARAVNKLWTKYDWWINFWLLLKKLFWFKVKINHIERYNCSEFVAYVNGLENLYVSPWDLLKSKELKNII